MAPARTDEPTKKKLSAGMATMVSVLGCVLGVGLCFDGLDTRGNAAFYTTGTRFDVEAMKTVGTVEMLFGVLAIIVSIYFLWNWFDAQPTEEAVEQGRVASGSARKCPFCAEVIKAEAIVCRYCGRDVEPLPKAEPAKAEVGPMGVAKPGENYRCPGCNKRIPRDAATCKHCNRQILPVTDSPEHPAAWKICTTCGKLISWNDRGATWLENARYHKPCTPNLTDTDEGGD